jgi:hypothetical protein
MTISKKLIGSHRNENLSALLSALTLLTILPVNHAGYKVFVSINKRGGVGFEFVSQSFPYGGYKKC